MGTFLIALAILAIVALIIRVVVKDHKTGKCVGGCAYCNMQGQCLAHNKKPATDKPHES